MIYLIFIFQASCAAALAYSCFCRIVRTDVDTHREIRLAIWFQGVAAGFVGGAPILPILNPLVYWKPWTTPWFAWAVLLLAATLMQLVTAKYWRDGVPKSFVRGES